MASYYVVFRSAFYGTVVAEHFIDNLGFSIRNSEPGDISFEIALGDPNLGSMADDLSIGPYRTDYYLYRAGQSGQYSLMVAGMITSVNLAKDRDTLLVSGKDWLHYLERRTFPFNPVQYLDMDTLDSNGNAYFEYWPQNYPYVPLDTNDPENFVALNKVEVVDIVEDLLLAMEQQSNDKFPNRPVTYLPALPGGVDAVSGPRGTLGLSMNNGAIGYETSYRIYPGDSTTIMEHIRKLSEQANGFEFDIIPGSREFKIWGPKQINSEYPASTRLQDQPIYTFTPTADEATGAIIEADWTNDGPDATVVVGLCQTPKHYGQVWRHAPSVDKYRWLDKVYDFGEIKDEELLLNMIKDQNDLYPQQKLSLTILNPEFLTPNFYTGDRPRSVIGNRIRFAANWSPYRPLTLTQDYQVNALNWSVDGNGNEEVEFELQTIYEDGIVPTP